MNYPRLIKKKECRVLTCWGWMGVLLVLSFSVAVFTSHIHPFLSVTEPVCAEILVVEEWIPPLALERAASEFKDHGYGLLVVLGRERHWVVPILREAGVAEKEIVNIPVRPAERDRTFGAAVALRNWLQSSGISSGTAANVFALGPHARRSWILFHEALGSDFAVGVISCEALGYDPGEWWETSEGFKNTIYETIAYIYTQLFFFPVKS